MKYLLLLVLLSVHASALTSESETKKKLIEKAIATSNHSEFSDITMLAYLKGLTVQLKSQSASGEQIDYEKLKSKAHKDASELAAQYYSQPEIQTALRDIYSRAFTEEELAQLIDFYESDFGKHFMQMYPMIFKLKIHMEGEVIEKHLETLKNSNENPNTKE
ncbi:DUF2059 domain-containing protein [Alteromonas antoniana]|uniref:DUF2059 domain-containing protein n=1 Tax=Alteromonas antoniana TaxID=2803813 RepID=UPI001C443A8D|nr:DUF2059 domain-containing protein [Alteromonas antoniana]